MNETKIHAILIASIILSLAIIAAAVPYNPAKAETMLKSFSSYEELKTFITTSRKNNLQHSYGLSGGPTMFPSSRFALSTFGAEDAAILPEYSVTNVQVEGVDEADIVKTDGTYIYVISKQDIIILKAYPPEDAEILSRIHFNGTIRGAFINENKLAVLEDTGYNGQYRTYSNFVPSQWTHIRIYNIADRANPTSTHNVTVEGTYFNSRMIGDYAYVVVNQNVLTAESNITLPKICYPDRIEEVPANQIYYSNTTDNFNVYTNIVSVNLLDDQQDPTVKTVLIGYASTMYVSQNNIYITYSTYQYQTQTTKIHRIHIDKGEIEYEATGEVPGYVLNQFSMDEFNGYFRVATTTGEVWSWGEYAARNHVYILDEELNTVGALEDLAPGEKIYSARFMGNRCYLVTFKKIDPLFVIDLTNPTSPEVLGELHITGYSDYLHPYDENHVIGIGKETVEAEGGNFAWYQGVKISLFDVTDVSDPKEIAKYEIGDRGTDSPILYDHKAFLFDRSRNLLVIPVRVAEINPAQYPGEVPDNAYGEIVWDGAYVFHISLEQGLEVRGKITHTTSSIQRSLYIGDVLYTISELKIKMNSLTDLTEINEILLNP